MKYTDRIYGKFEIKEPVVLELIKSSSLQRLKGIDQHGHFEPYFPGGAYSRFEHSLGVCCLLHRFGASLEEQIAGLLHDVSHTVFSHCIDFVYKSGSTQCFQDRLHKSFIKKSAIPKILKKYKIDYRYVLDEKNFPLKEKELPDLCADRIDYSLREAIVYKQLTKKEIKEILDNLIIVNHSWVFKNKKIAKKFTLCYLKLNNTYWAGFKTAWMFESMGQLLRYALKKRIINREDLFTTDKNIWSKIRPATKNDSHLRQLINRADAEIMCINGNKNDYDVYSRVKSRAVDPLVKIKNSLKRVSQLDKKYAKLIKQNLAPKEYYIKFLD